MKLSSQVHPLVVVACIGPKRCLESVVVFKIEPMLLFKAPSMSTCRYRLDFVAVKDLQIFVGLYLSIQSQSLAETSNACEETNKMAYLVSVSCKSSPTTEVVDTGKTFSIK